MPAARTGSRRPVSRAAEPWWPRRPRRDGEKAGGGAGRGHPPGEPRRPTNCCWQLGRNPELRPPLCGRNQTRSRKWLLPGETRKQSLRGHDSRSDSGAGEATLRGDLALHYRKQVLLSNPLHSPGGPRVPEPTRRAGFAQHSCRMWLLSGQPANRPSSRRERGPPSPLAWGPTLHRVEGKFLGREWVGWWAPAGAEPLNSLHRPPASRRSISAGSNPHFRKRLLPLPVCAVLERLSWLAHGACFLCSGFQHGGVWESVHIPLFRLIRIYLE